MLNSALKKYDLQHPTALFSNAGTTWADAVCQDAGFPVCSDPPTDGIHSATGYYYPIQQTVNGKVEWIARCDNEAHNL